MDEWSYVKICYFVGKYLLYGNETTLRGFVENPYQSYLSVPTIQTHLYNISNSSLPPDAQRPPFNGLLFDFRAGNANMGDSACGWPLAMCGQEAWLYGKFDWTADISSEAVPYVSVESFSDPLRRENIFWQIRPGAGVHSGHVAVTIPYGQAVDSVSFRVRVQPVPEPGAILPLGSGLLRCPEKTQTVLTAINIQTL